ncbi:hypothetical protein FKM82_023938 [Ascaphus truei]
MKAAVILLMLGAFLIHADALQCRKSACVGSRPCTHSTVTCGSGVDQCFVMMKSSPIFMMTRGCITESNCLKMKSWEHSTRCCTSDLCN